MQLILPSPQNSILDEDELAAPPPPQPAALPGAPLGAAIDDDALMEQILGDVADGGL
jgi:hypothetical protein